jgi:hypothetical protein
MRRIVPLIAALSWMGAVSAASLATVADHPRDGASDLSSVCGALVDGEACDDANLCTTNDHCESGACTGEPIQCGRCEACDPGMGCHPALAETCRHSVAPWANRFEIRHGPDASGDRLTWQWRRGESTPPDALGDPFGGDDYTLCVFGQRGRSVLVAIEASSGGTCGNEPCWSHRGPAGIRYRDWAASEGVASLRVDAKRNGKAKAVVQGRGAALGLPPLPLPLPLTVQLRAGDGACWEATYDKGDVFQDQLQLRAHGPRP